MVKFDDSFSGSIKSSYNLFNEMKCNSGNSKRSCEFPMDLKTLDEDKMRCRILDCLVALYRVQREKDIDEISHRYESTKRRIFAGAVSLIINGTLTLESDQHIISSLLASFPDGRKRTDGRSWLPLHFAVALGNVVDEEDIHKLYSNEPLAMRRYNLIKPFDSTYGAHTPGHFLCMQTHPNISLIRYLSLRDIKSFTMPAINRTGYTTRNCLQLAAKYSVSVELLKTLLQVDHSMIKTYDQYDSDITPLGLLCERSKCMFSSFDAMMECLIIADGSAEGVSESLVSYFGSFERNHCIDVKVALLLIKTLLELINDKEMLNSVLHSACSKLEGDFCIAVLSLILNKYGVDAVAALKVRDDEGKLSVHLAAEYSSLDVVQFLLVAWPESLLERVTGVADNLLHMALSDKNKNRKSVNAKVQYLCGRCPNLLCMKDGRNRTPFMDLICNQILDLDTMKIMCETKETIVSEEYASIEEDEYEDYMLPLGLLVENRNLDSEVSIATSCFRFLLHLYPAGLSVQEQRLYIQIEELENHFITRLTLNADKSICPEKARDLNDEARKEGMFLAFTAVTSDGEPTIWIKLRHESKDLLMHTISFL